MINEKVYQVLKILGGYMFCTLLKNYNLRYGLTLIFFNLVLLACTNSSLTPDPSKYNWNLTIEQEKILDDLPALENLYKLVGNAEASTYLLLLQGGPSAMLSVPRGNSRSNGYLLYHEEFTVVHLHQANTLDPSLATTSNPPTKTSTEATAANLKSAAIVFQVGRAFKEKGKKIYMLSSSFGSSLILRYLSEFPNVADKIAITSGRVDMPNNFVTLLEGGKGAKFNSCSTFGGEFSMGNAGILAADIFRPRYTQKLANIELENTFYGHVENDNAVGPLCPAELTFLTNKGFTVHKFTSNHLGPIFNDADAQIVVDFLKN